jgi:hypothetical protein
MQPLGAHHCVGGRKNRPRVGSSVFLESAGTEVGQVGSSNRRSWSLGVWHSFLGGKGRASYIKLTTNIPLQQFTSLVACTLVPQLLELHGIVDNRFQVEPINVRA